jgi:hypothetical protein
MAPADTAKDEIKVFVSTRDSVCGECGEELDGHAWMTLAGEKGTLCLECADLDHLAYLPSGDAALTRRAKKHSLLWAVVLRWSRRRRRYERQGLLVEEEALNRAEAECLADADARGARRAREATRREIVDRQYVEEYGRHIRDRYPLMPQGLETKIAEHACLKHSGRVGRSSRAKKFSAKTITLAVAAHVRHEETNYDDLLMGGTDRQDARAQVREKIEEILDRWSTDT